MVEHNCRAEKANAKTQAKPTLRIMKIEISNRITLYFSDDGFKFTNKLRPPQQFEKWDNWPNHWPLYANDKIIEKVFSFLDSLPDRFKGRNFYQQIKFIKDQIS